MKRHPDMNKENNISNGVKKYEFLDHTADLGVRVWGRSLSELFMNAADAMFGFICDVSKASPAEPFLIEVQAIDKDQLLKEWLSELLYYFNTKNIIFSQVKIEKISDEYIKSEARGEKIDKNKHDLRHEVKAVTYHHLHIEKQGETLTTEIIFDV